MPLDAPLCRTRTLVRTCLTDAPSGIRSSVAIEDIKCSVEDILSTCIVELAWCTDMVLLLLCLWGEVDDLM